VRTSNNAPARPLPEFGRYLRSLREAPSRWTGTQREAVERLRALGLEASQSLLNKYENGVVADPDPAVLQGLARIYEVDYMELVLHLVREKYRPPRSPSPAVYEARLMVCAEALKPFHGIGGINDNDELEVDQLKAKARLIHDEQVLDVKGMARWERLFPDLKRFWVAVDHFIDNADKDIETAVVENLGRGVTYMYFIPRRQAFYGGTFFNWKHDLLHRLAKPELEMQLVAVPLDDEQLQSLRVDYAIANPSVQGTAPFGFQCIRDANGQPKFAFQVDPKALNGVIALLAEWAQKYISTEAAKQATDGEAPAEAVKRGLRVIQGGKS
jgi:transcriptional regulator with XRE-family HTH domain